MSKPIHVVGFAGSLRKASWNAGLLREAQALAPEGMTIEIVDLLEVPLYNGDVEAAGLPASVLHLRERFKAADAAIIVTPEYNGSISAVTKNAYDWLTRVENLIPDKPTLLMGVSAGGTGASRAHNHLSQIAKGGQARLVEPFVQIPFGGQKFESAGVLIDESVRPEILRGLQDLLKLAREEPAK